MSAPHRAGPAPTLDHTDVAGWVAAGRTLGDWQAAGGEPLDWELGGGEVSANDAVEAAFPLLSALRENPSLREAPECIVPRLAWRGRTTMHVGEDKLGKSTLWSWAAASVSRGGEFLGEDVPQGRVLWLGLEEALEDVVRRFDIVDADADHIRVLTEASALTGDRLENIWKAKWAPDLIVVDSLTAYAQIMSGGVTPREGDNGAWSDVVRPLVRLGHQKGCAIVLLHHARRSDGKYRGASDNAAAVDWLWEMFPAQRGEDQTLRRLAGRGRLRGVERQWAYRLDAAQENGRPLLVGQGWNAVPSKPLSLAERIIEDTAENPGTTRSKQYERVRGKRHTYFAEVKSLVDTGRLLDQDGRLYRHSS